MRLREWDRGPGLRRTERAVGLREREGDKRCTLIRL